MHICFRPLFDDVRWINFRFRLLVTWSSPHGRDASSMKFGADVFIQSGTINIFPKLKMGAAAILDLHDIIWSMWAGWYGIVVFNVTLDTL